MLLIPIGQEDNLVRRVPWVSIAILVLNLAVFLGTNWAEANSDQRVSTAIQRYFQYLDERPHLELTPDVATKMPPDLRAELDRRRAQAIEDLDDSDTERITQQQAELDERARALVAAIDAAPARRFGYIPARGGLATALSSLFVHGGWMHLLGNMLFFFLSGPFLEDRFGRTLFAGFYLVSGLVATISHAMLQPDSTLPLIGASGAIAGVMGGFLVRLWRARIRFLLLPVVLLPMWRYKPVLPAFVVLPLWFGEQLLYASTSGAESGVAFSAHVGGFVFGVGAALLIKLTQIEERHISPQIEAATTLEQHPALEQALDARLRGDFAAARAHLDLVLRQQPDNLDAWSESYELALAQSDTARVGSSGTRLLELLVRRQEEQLASQLVLDRRWRALSGVPARWLLSVAAFLDRAGDRRAAIEVLEQAGTCGAHDGFALRALTRRGELLAKAGDRHAALRAYQQALAHPACLEPWPATIQRALEQLEDRTLAKE